jgi:simple sugar transport system substrate-binding protein
MKLKIALLSVAMSSAYIFSGSVFAAEKYEIALVAKSMVSHGLTGWGLA